MQLLNQVAFSCKILQLSDRTDDFTNVISFEIFQFFLLITLCIQNDVFNHVNHR